MEFIAAIITFIAGYLGATMGAVMNWPDAGAMLERHLPKQLLDLVDKARDLLPEHQSYRQEQQREKGHSWGDMSL